MLSASLLAIAYCTVPSYDFDEMSAPDWYPNWRHEAFHLLQEKNEALSERFQLRIWPRFDYDLETRELTFSEDGQVRVVADIQVVGTTSENAGNWLWAWGNSHWPEDCIEDAERVRSFGVEHGIDELIRDYVEDENLNSLGWELTAVAARICGSAGAYRPPRDEGGGFFLLYRDVRWAN